MDFDLQRFLEGMRTEARFDSAALTVKVDNGFKFMNDRMQSHELADQAAFAHISERITPLEGVHKTMKWFVRACVVAAIGMLIDVALNHVGPAVIQLVQAASKQP